MKREQTVRVRLFGGLGNQLFQYFAGLDVATKFDLQLEIDTRWITNSYSHDKSDIQDFEFLNQVDMITAENSGEINYLFERLKTKLAQKSLLFANTFKLDSPSDPNSTEIKISKKNLELRGYYQSYLYFKNLTSRLGKVDWKLTVESKEFLKVRDHLLFQPFIAIHVRGGDYLNSSSFYHRLDDKYYKESLMAIRDEIGYLRTIVFTDDYEYAKRILNEIEGLEFLDQKGLRASESMILMSEAKGIVISNSTFSYWAAVINSSPFIVAPKLWFSNTSVDENLYPPKWKSM